MRAAVLTVSDGVASGSREDSSGDQLEQLLRGRGVSCSAAGRSRRAGRDRRSHRRAVRECAARADHGWHRLWPAGCHAGGDRRGARAPGSRHRRGHQGGRDPQDTARAPFSWSRRRPRPVAGGQPAGLARGCRDGFAVLKPAIAHALELLGDGPAGATGERDRGNRLPPALRFARQARAHRFCAAICLCRCAPGCGRRSDGARPGLADGRDGGGTIAGDGCRPADRCTDRCT